MNKEPAEGPAAHIVRGVCRLLADMGYSPLTEFTLTTGRHVDVAGLRHDGRFAVVEVKSSAADFRADGKWPQYLPHCDAFYFAVDEDFPRRLLPAGCGVIVADAYGGAVVAEAAETPMNGTRRGAQVQRFARCAADRLRGLLDPQP